MLKYSRQGHTTTGKPRRSGFRHAAWLPIAGLAGFAAALLRGLAFAAVTSGKAGAANIPLGDLYKSEKLWRQLIANSADAMVIVDSTGQIVLVNPRAEEMFGYPQADLLGRPVEMLIPETVRQAHLGHRQGYFDTPRPRPMGYGLELAGRRRDGSEFPVSISLIPLEMDDGTVAVATISDITEARRAQEELKRLNADLNTYATELERSNVELQQFAYVSSHDLKEPLRMVTSYLNLLERRYKGQLDSDAQEFIGFAVDGATRMQNLINDLLAYSRVGTHGQPFGLVDLESVLDQALANLQVMIEENGAQVTHDPLPTLAVDATQLIALFQNLIGNGIKFHGSRSPQVHVSARETPGEWVFSVRDNGIGIEAGFYERIFVIFQRLHSRSEYPGTGIGLAVCKKIVERHDGRIWVESVIGDGSTFLFTIPKSQGAAP